MLEIKITVAVEAPALAQAINNLASAMARRNENISVIAPEPKAIMETLVPVIPPVDVPLAKPPQYTI